MDNAAREMLVCDLCSCDKDTYCTAKELLKMSKKFAPRFLLQVKCIEIFKYDIGEALHKDVGWEEATEEWTEVGYAMLFDSVTKQMQDDGLRMRPIDVYRRIKNAASQQERHEKPKQT